MFDIKFEHLSITWDITTNSKNTRTFSTKKFCFRKGNYDQLKHNLDLIDWQSKLLNRNTNEMYEIFLQEYNSLCEQSIPKLKQKICKPRAPWVTKEVLNLSALKKKTLALIPSNGMENT